MAFRYLGRAGDVVVVVGDDVVVVAVDVFFYIAGTPYDAAPARRPSRPVAEWVLEIKWVKTNKNYYLSLENIFL